MRTTAKAVAYLLGVLMVLSCSEKPLITEPGVSAELARQRAAVITDIHYRLRFDIPADPAAPVPASAVITFDLAATGMPLQLDFRQDGANIKSLRSNGKKASYQFIHEHLVVPARALRVGRNQLEIDFLASQDAFNRKPDFLYTLFVPDRARTAFPLFDQPDLKARFELTLATPANWLALSSAPLAALEDLGERLEYRFQNSDLVSSYLFSFVAGRFEAVTREVDGRQMTMLHRETDSAKLARNLDAIFALHASSLRWLENYTGIDYPFRKFDFVLIPDFPYGGMEHVGLIQYRAALLLLDAEPSDTRLLNRAQLIAHETAHMWFGNLVTMRWFNDVWTKEVFANFMAGKIVNPEFPAINHDLNFLADHYPAAYAVDRSEGANPIRQQLDNLNEAGQMYGSIIYHKAPIMMRQLELLVGPDRFQQGMREYLQNFSHANATWPDLVAILDEKSPSDLAAWSDVWVNTPGRPEFRPASSPPGDSKYPPALEQVDPAGLGRSWPQQFRVAAIGAAAMTTATVLAADRHIPLPAAVADQSGTRLYNADGYGYGLFPADMALFGHWEQLDEVARGALLVNSYENLLAGTLPDVNDYFAHLLGIVQVESNQLLLELAMGQLQYVYLNLLTPAQQLAQTPGLEQALWDSTISQPDSSLTKRFFQLYAQLASSKAEVGRLYAIWEGRLAVEQLVLEEPDRIELAEILAIRLPGRANEIVRRQLEQTTDPDRRSRLEFIAPALSADAAVRDAFFESLADPDNRATEAWVADALRRLHHPSRLQQSAKYLLPSLELLQEIQVTGDIFFPSRWLQASLENQHSAAAAKTVRRFLEQRPDYNRQLRMKILQAADPLLRAAEIRGSMD